MASNLLFSQAGHLVPAYQPEASFRIFERLINHCSIATGGELQDNVDLVDFARNGPAKSTTLLTPPESPGPVCFIRDIKSCPYHYWALVANRKGVAYNGVMYNSTEDYIEPPPLPAYPPVPAVAEGAVDER